MVLDDFPDDIGRGAPADQHPARNRTCTNTDPAVIPSLFRPRLPASVRMAHLPVCSKHVQSFRRAERTNLGLSRWSCPGRVLIIKKGALNWENMAC